MIPRWLQRLAADLRAHRLLHAVTVLTVALSTLVVGGTLLAGVNAAEALAAWRRETRILVHLRPLAALEREELERRLRAEEGIAAVRFLPREEAFAELRRHFPNLELLFEPFDDLPLPDAFEVVPQEAALAAVERLARTLRALPEIEEVAYPRRSLEGLQAFLDFLRRGGLLLLGLAILAAIAMVAATTRLVLLARREEIELLRLFGAGSGLLHGRFLLGGLLHGAAGGGLGLGLLRGLFDALQPAAAPLAQAAGLAPRFLTVAEAAGLVAGAAAAGAIGALASLGRGPRGVPGGLLALAAGLLLAGAVRAAASEPAGGTAAVDPLHREAEVLRRGQREMEADLERLQRRETDVAAALDQAARRLADSRRRAAAAQAEHEALADRVRLLQEARSDLEGRLAELKRALAKRLWALYGVHRLGPAAFGGALAASPVERQRAEAGLKRLLAHDARLLSALAEDAAELADLQARLEADTARLGEQLTRLEEELRALSLAAAERERLLARIRLDRDARRTAAERLEEAGTRLEEQMRTLMQPAADGATASAEAPMAAAKGLLLFPLQGSMKSARLLQRSPGPAAAGFRKGIEIAAERGEPVRAVHGGTVLFADWFGGYGNMIVIDHGDHVYSLYAHLEDLFTAPDRRVAPGDVIATVGDSGPLGVSSLYFELRHRERSLDPLEWFPPQ